MIGSGRAHGGLYLLEASSQDSLPSIDSSHEALQADSSPALLELHQWHRRLGHPSFGVLGKLFPLLVKQCTHNKFICDACELAKHKRTSYPSFNNKSTAPFMIVHSDVWGPSRVVTLSGYRWFVTFIDCYSRVTWVYLLRHKDEVFSCFRTFHKMVSTQFDAKIRVLRSDNGTEYANGEFRAYLADHGILHQTTCVDTPAQNGVAERKNRHLLEVARSLIFTMQVPTNFWGDAVLTAAYLINRMPLSTLDFQVPLDLLQGTSLGHRFPLRVFGCVCFVHDHRPSRGKLDPKALRCVFLGYSATQKGYKCYHPSSRKTFVSMDVTFHESVAFFPSSSSLQGESCVIQEEMDFVCPPTRTATIQGEAGVPMEGEQVTCDVERATINQPSKCGRLDRNDLKTYVRSRLPVKCQTEQTTCVPPTLSQSHSPTPGPSSPPSSSNFESSGTDNPVIVDIDVPIAVRKGIRSCTQHPISNFVSYSSLSPSYRAFVSSLSSVSIPQGWKEALADPNWKEAMAEEMRALEKNGTWDFVGLPNGKKPVGCKWVYTIKQKADGTIDRYKARLVAKGFTQTYGIDYQETFAPVAKMNSVRVLLSCAANQGWLLHQLDVKNAFLHGDLEEEVYMEMPPGFSSQTTNGKVCRLKKALYGLKQSPRAWFGRFHKAMVKIGYKQSNADHTLFIKRRGDMITVLIVYVDDIVVTGNDSDEVSKLKVHLAREFEIKDLGSLRYFLGIEVARSDKGIFISQRKYVLDLLKETGMLGCKPVDSPIEVNHRLMSGDGDLVDKERFQRLVGRLIYLAHTRPDIAYAVGVVSQFMHDPCTTHLDAVYRILKYLKSAPGKGVLFSNHGHLELEAFTDADWAGSINDRRSTSGYCTLVGGNLVTWRSKKQSVVARSSAEAEYRAMAHGICELIWLQTLLRDLGIVCNKSMRLYCDNKSAINIAHNPVQHDRTKHIEIDRHFIKEKLNEGMICTPFVKSEDQLADVFTKGLSSRFFHSIVCKLGMRDIYAPT
uniref:Putative polyprotein n=1 Tax=Davidia involucrata TaxID=16924 RepID=A0A5B6Z677_DAVIN